MVRTPKAPLIALEGAEKQGVEMDGTGVQRAEFEEVTGAGVGPVAEEGGTLAQYQGAPVRPS